jgi:metallo-beta-lactamase class B
MVSGAIQPLHWQPARENLTTVMTVRTRILFALFSLLLAAAPAHGQSYGHSDPNWTTPIAPFRIADNLYYVGSRDLATYLIVTPKGDILINSGLTTSPPLIVKSIAQLGFNIRDVKILLISHAHFDHDAGSAELKRLSHAKYMVMEGDVANVRSGGATDFAYPGDRYPPTKVDHILHDGDQVALGGVVLTPHKTAGHTQGCTTWTMKAISGGKPRDVLIVGSWNVNGDFRLVDRPGHPASYPGIVVDYERGFAILQSLPCDIFLGAHGAYFDMLKKLARAQTGEGDAVWIDPDGYRKALAEKHQAFEAELKRQQGSP